MNENIQKGEITFQAIWTLIKKSFVRIVIYALITAIVVGGLSALIIMLAKDDASYQAMLEYNYDGAEKGLDPWGRELDVSKIKSDNIVTQALIDCNYTEEERGELKSQIIDNITIAGVVPEDVMTQILIIKEIATKTPSQLTELNELSYTSTSYVVKLINDKKMGLSASECTTILNSIVDNYIDYFKEEYGFGNVLGTLIAGDIDKNAYDYIEIHDIYDSQITEITEYLDEMISKSSAFRSTTNKLTFEDLKARVISVSDYDLKKLEIYIYSNGVSNGSLAVNVTTYINEKIEVINRDIAATQAAVTATQSAIDSYEFAYNSRTDSNNNIEKTLANGETYDQLQTDLRTYQIKLVKENTTKTLWTERLGKFDPQDDPLTPNIDESDPLTEEEKAQVALEINAMIDKIDTSLAEEVGYINQAVNEYIDTEVMKDSIGKTVSAVKSETESDSLKLILIIEALSIFIACLAAIGVTSSKDKKSKLALANVTKKEEIKAEEKTAK